VTECSTLILVDPRWTAHKATYLLSSETVRVHVFFPWPIRCTVGHWKVWVHQVLHPNYIASCPFKLQVCTTVVQIVPCCLVPGIFLKEQAKVDMDFVPFHSHNEMLLEPCSTLSIQCTTVLSICIYRGKYLRLCDILSASRRTVDTLNFPLWLLPKLCGRNLMLAMSIRQLVYVW
jgi:hypothetical protein